MARLERQLVADGSNGAEETDGNGHGLRSADPIVDGLAVGVVLAALGFWGYCVVDFTRTDEYEMRTFSKPVWVMLLLFMNIFGGLMWLYYGRPLRR
jgi:hypothetical protein